MRRGPFVLALLIACLAARVVLAASVPPEPWWNAVSESERWPEQWRLDHTRPVTSPVVVLSDAVLVCDWSGVMRCVARANGEVRWTRSLPGTVRGARLASAADLVVFGVGDSLVVALGAARGEVRWTFDTAGADQFSYEVAVDDSVAVFGSSKDSLYVVRLGDGRCVARVPIDGRAHGRPMLIAGDVFFATQDHPTGSALPEGRLVRMRRSTGEIVWSRALPADGRFEGGASTGPVGDGNAVLVASHAGQVYAFDSADGRLIWRVSVGSPVIASPVLANGALVVGTLSPSLRALEADTGEVRWTLDSGGSLLPGNVSADEGRVFFASAGGNIAVVSARTGRVLHRCGPGFAPVHRDRTLFYGGLNDRMGVYPLIATHRPLSER